METSTLSISVRPTSNLLPPTSLTSSSIPSFLPLAPPNSPPQSKSNVSRGETVAMGIGSACGTVIIISIIYRARRYYFRSRQRHFFPQQQQEKFQFNSSYVKLPDHMFTWGEKKKKVFHFWRKF